MDKNILALAPALAQPHFEAVPQALLEEWAGDTWPEGDWNMDHQQVRGLLRVVSALRQGLTVTVVATPVGPGTLTLREASPLHKGKGLQGMAYPHKGLRGPEAEYTREGEFLALKAFVVSRMFLAGPRCLRFVPCLQGFRAEVVE